MRPPRPYAANLRRSEAGMTLVEMLVVMLIVAVISTFAVMSMSSSRSTGGRLELRAAASRYADAAERYQQDHGRKAPTFGGPDWPTSSANAGPVKTLEIQGTVIRPYLRGAAPDVMTRRGPKGAVWASSPPAESSTGGVLVYVLDGTYSFHIEAWWDGKLVCSAGDVSDRQNVC
jgi:prepilin-type N-terminal cleavage/methylation domain-containing protein